MTNVGIIDIGSNSVRLLVAEVNKSKVTPIYQALDTTRLGQGIGSGRILNQAVNRTINALGDMQKICREKSAEVTAVATSAVRDAKNREWFLQEVLSNTGLEVRVLSGEEEAYYGYIGVSAGFSNEISNALIIDIGGGSTEFTWVHRGKLISRSVKVGAVRMTESNCDNLFIAKALKCVFEEVMENRPSRIIGIGGTVTTLAAMDMQLTTYDSNRVHGYIIETEKIQDLFEELVRAGSEGRKRMKGLQPARADIIVAGVRILMEIVKGLKFDFIQVSEADLLYGLALEVASCRNKKSHK